MAWAGEVYEPTFFSLRGSFGFSVSNYTRILLRIG